MIAQRVQLLTAVLAKGLNKLGYSTNDTPVFDTIKVTGGAKTQDEIRQAALSAEINLRYYDDGGVGISLDEITGVADLEHLFAVFGADAGQIEISTLADEINLDYAEGYGRNTEYLTHPVFNSYHSETEMMRYINKLAKRDLSLTHSMIPLGILHHEVERNGRNVACDVA